jgi:hypothetical protein
MRRYDSKSIAVKDSGSMNNDDNNSSIPPNVDSTPDKLSENDRLRHFFGDDYAREVEYYERFIDAEDTCTDRKCPMTISSP